MTFTRKQFWERFDATRDAPDWQAQHAALHHEYYIQYATPYLRKVVAERIGKARIETSTDPHFNDIPLREWDALNDTVKALCDHTVRREAEPCAQPNHFIWSLSTGVCVAKAIAREIRDAAKVTA